MSIRKRLIQLLADFETLQEGDLRPQVLALVPAVHLLRKLGSSLVPAHVAASARERILHYLTRYPFTVISGDELGVVSGISEYARRVRELRVQFGWPIYSGSTAKEMLEAEELSAPAFDIAKVEAMRPDDYILLGTQDRDAAHRWHRANEIRRLRFSVQDRILLYMRENVGRPITGEELRYVAQNASEWARRTRELRTEEGWPVMTRNSGRFDLPVGVYVLEADRQSQPHDRNIPDSVRVAVLERDGFKCRVCSWSPAYRRQGDPRALLELHHVEHHVEGGGNEAENLVTLCNVDHDQVHRLNLRGTQSFFAWLDQQSPSS